MKHKPVSADFSLWCCLMVISMEKERQSQLLDSGGCWNWTQSPACDTPGVQSYLLVGLVSPCGDTEGTWAQGVGTGKGPVAGERGIFPLPDQDSTTYFALILQFACSTEEDLKILQRWQKKTKVGDDVSAVWSCCLGGGSGELWFPGVTETNYSYLLRLMEKKPHTSAASAGWKMWNYTHSHLQTLTSLVNYHTMNWYMVTFLYSPMANAQLISHP